MAAFKVNPFSKANNDTGFGTQANRIGGRFVNKDGSFNLRKTGYPWWRRASPYSWLLQLSWSQFMGIVVLFYVLVNVVFAAVYLMLGPAQFLGIHGTTRWQHFRELFFFSTQTFTTVGYGRLNPFGDGAEIVASVETMSGWLFFALVTGLLYGRFTRPQAFLAFSENAIVAPYRSGIALMFRMVPYKSQHYLTDAQVVVNAALQVAENGKSEYRFFNLLLERSRIDAFNMNWTVVHPIDEQSPFLGMSAADLDRSDLELYVQVSGFDHVFSNTVMQRTSYTAQELVWGARFLPMYHESEQDDTTIIALDKLNDFEKAALPLSVNVERHAGSAGSLP